MNIQELNERIEQSAGHIDKLVWIGASEVYNDALQDLIQELNDEDQKTYFPTLINYDGWDAYGSEAKHKIAEYLYDEVKLGFLARIHIPECHGFMYNDKGVPSGWGVSGGISRVRHVYADTLELLVDEIEKVTESVFNDYIRIDKARKAKKV